MAFKGTIITSKAELFKELDAAPCAKVTAIFRDKTDPALKASRAMRVEPHAWLRC